jgi:hypothetical protein
MSPNADDRPEPGLNRGQHHIFAQQRATREHGYFSLCKHIREVPHGATGPWLASRLLVVKDERR